MKKIMFLCSAGMSTSMLVNKVKEAAAGNDYECEIFATGEADAKNHYDDIDVILLGPQVRFLLSKVKKAVEGKNVKVEVIDTTNYGRMDGEAVLKQIMQLCE